MDLGKYKGSKDFSYLTKERPFNVYSIPKRKEELTKELVENMYINDRFEDYIENWNYYYYLIVGGYGSSKSYNTAIKLMLKAMKEKRTILVVREVYDTHKDSTFALFEDLIETYDIFKGVAKTNQSPLRISFTNGSKIIFKGMDKPKKLKSIHNVSIVWLEEATEIKYEGFKELIGRLRHPTLSLHIILTSNPVSKSSWVYKRFFKDEDDPENPIIVLDDELLYKKKTIIQGDTYYHHSTCEDNYYLPKSYINQLDKMKLYDPDLYRIAKLGRFGATGKKVLPQFEVLPREKVFEEINKIRWVDKLERYGMDFGFVTSYNALVGMVVDKKNQVLYLTDCYYSKDKTDPQIAADIVAFMDVEIIADNAEPKAIRYFNQQGFSMRKCRKFKGSRAYYTKKVKRFTRIVCCSDLKPIIKELKDLTFKVNSNGDIIEDEFNIDPHTLSAIWYGLDSYEVPDPKFALKNKKGGSI